MERWVGLGVIVHDLRVIAQHQAARVGQLTARRVIRMA